MDTSAQSLLDQYTRMRADASGMFTLWDEAGRLCLTRKVSALTAAINRTAHASDHFTPYEAAIVNSTAVESVTVHAAGCNSWITPHDGDWFKFEPHREFQRDSVASWLAECTEVTQLYLRSSNFYTRVHELYIDRVVSGTAVLTAEAGRSSPLNFRVFDPGSFVIADNEESTADLLFRERQLTARQAVEKFGDSAPARIRAEAAQKPHNLHRFLQAVYPRPDKERNRPGSAGMPFAECWVSVDDKTKIAEAGFEEIPFFANRYLRWSEFSPWGASPAMQALAEIRGVNFLDMLSCVAAETAVNPRIILPQGFQGVPDLRAGGITMGGLTRDTYPQEWLSGGRFDIGEAIVARKEQVIRSLFHVPLFEQFATIDRQITATEVRAREAEKVARFSPAFTQLTTELLNPLLQRVFMLLFRAGKLPPPPREALYQDAGGQWRMQFPQVVQTSRMALAIQSLKQSALSDWLGLAMPLAQRGSEVLDNLDEDAAFRDLALGGGMPASYLRESEARDAMRQARAQAQQAAQQGDMMREMMKSRPVAEAGLAALQQQPDMLAQAAPEEALV